MPAAEPPDGNFRETALDRPIEVGQNLISLLITGLVGGRGGSCELFKN
jgi:hypothetical protein